MYTDLTKWLFYHLKLKTDTPDIGYDASTRKYYDEDGITLSCG